MVKYQIAARAQVLELLAAGLPGKHVEEHTGHQHGDAQYRWWDKAVARGFDPNQRPLVILDGYVEDGKRLGRPRSVREGMQDCDAAGSIADDTTLEVLRERGRERPENENENENEAYDPRQQGADEFPDFLQDNPHVRKIEGVSTLLDRGDQHASLDGSNVKYWRVE